MNKLKQRKPRSDAGKKRGPNSKQRCDIGKPRTMKPTVKTALTIYRKMISTYCNDESVNIVVDINNIFVPYQEEKRRIEKEHSVLTHGQRIFRDTRLVKGRYIDLEKYRFNALQELATEDWSYDSYYTFQEIIATLLGPDADNLIDTPMDLFCRLYHIKQEDSIRWSYEKWRHEYNIVYDDANPLSNDFEFYLDKEVGKDYALEYSEDLQLANESAIDEIKDSRDYILTRARMQQYLYSKQYSEVSRRITTDPANNGLTYNQLKKLIDSSIDQERLDKDLEDYMSDWVNDQIRIKGKRR